MNFNRNKLTTEIVNGRRAWIVRKHLLLFIFWQLAKSSKNLFIAFKKLLELKKLRASVHGNSKLSKFVRSGKIYYWVPDLPGMPSDNLKHSMRQELNRTMPNGSKSSRQPVAQQTIIWGITNRCALRCNHCYDWDNIDTKDHLNLEQLKQVLAKIENQGIRHVQLSGGEPLTRFDDLISILNEASRRIDFWLLTSGYGLTREKARRLKEAGLIGAHISLDHWQPLKHNSFRNNDKSYYWVEQAVANCREAGIIAGLSLCATREFVNEFNLMAYASLAREMGVQFIRILEPRQAGHFAAKDVLLPPEKIKIISRFAIQMNSDPSFANFPIVSFFGYHQRGLGCFGAGNRYLYIDANGDFHACPFCRGRKGNILTHSFNQVIEQLRQDGCQVFKTAAEANPVIRDDLFIRKTKTTNAE